MIAVALEDPAETSVDREIVDATVAAIGVDAALQTYRGHLADVEAEIRQHGEADPDLIKVRDGWIAHARRLLERAHVIRSAIADVEAMRAGAERAQTPRVDPDERDRAVIRLMVAEGLPGPTYLRRGLSALSGPGMHEARRLGVVEADIENVARCFRDGLHGVDHAKLESRLRELAPERDRLRSGDEARRVALASIRAHLAEHASEAVPDVEAIANGLHARAALAESSRLAEDVRLRSLNLDLSIVQREYDSLSFAGKVAISIKGDELATRKRELEKSIAARRREIFADLGRPTGDVAKAAASGDIDALEQVALAVLADPSCFAPGTLARILDVQAAALCQAASAVVDALSPPAPEREDRP